MAEPTTLYVTLRNGKTYPIAEVTATPTIVTQNVVDGTYRDQPPIVVGGAGGVGYASDGAGGYFALPSFQIAGGVDPSVTTSVGIAGSVTATGASSVLQDDGFTHVAPRSLTTPIAYWVFVTAGGISQYALVERVVLISNAAPPGWSP